MGNKSTSTLSKKCSDLIYGLERDIREGRSQRRLTTANARHPYFPVLSFQFGFDELRKVIIITSPPCWRGRFLLRKIIRKRSYYRRYITLSVTFKGIYLVPERKKYEEKGKKKEKKRKKKRKR